MYVLVELRMILFIEDESFELCDFYWSTCFHLAMTNTTRRNDICKARCLPDCEGVFYETDVTSEYLDEETLPG